MNDPMNTVPGTGSPAPKRRSKFVTGLLAVLRYLGYVALFFGVQTAVASSYITALIVQGGNGVPTLNEVASGAEAYVRYAAEQMVAHQTGILLVSYLITLLLVCLFQTLRKKKLPDSLMLRPFNPFRIATFALFGVALNLFISLTASFLPIPESILAQHEAAFAGVTGDESVLGILSVTIVTGITEEIVFRGIGLTRLSAVGGAFAVAFSSFVFGLSHGTVLAIAYAFVIGTVFALVAARYRSILPSIICHAAFNGAAYIPVANDLRVLIPVYVISAAVLLFCVYRIFFRYPVFSDVALDRTGVFLPRDEEESRILDELKALRSSEDATPEDLERIRTEWEDYCAARKKRS